MGQFFIQQNPYDKRLNIKLEGMFSEQDWHGLLASYQQQVDMINPEEYQIELDCTAFPLAAASQWQRLEEGYQLFDDQAFRRISLIIRESADRLDHSFHEAVMNVRLPKLELRVV